jgi:maleate isomerase
MQGDNAAMTEYAARGLIGLLTPQANTTVEPEFNILLPPGYAHLNARLVSGRATIEERLVDYFERLEVSCAQFANAPLGAIAVACTGSSYLVGRDREDAILSALSSRRGMPAYTAATAVVDALRKLGARRIALGSPYPESLTRQSVAYWQSRGFEVAQVQSLPLDAGQFHPIYALPGEMAAGLIERLSVEKAGAILLLGTGMPTLRALGQSGGKSGMPVLSCMLCLGWRAVDLLAPGGADIAPWVDGSAWRARLLAHTDGA